MIVIHSSYLLNVYNETALNYMVYDIQRHYNTQTLLLRNLYNLVKFIPNQVGEFKKNN